MFKYLLLALVWLVYPLLARANWIIPPHTLSKECTAVDLRAALGPNRDQGDIGWCYANAAADLMTFRFKDLLKGERASATYLALAYNKYFFLNPNSEGGQISLALWPAQVGGFCRQSTEELILNLGPQVSFKKKLSGLIYLKQHFDQTSGASLDQDLMKYFARTKSILMRIPRSDLRDLLSYSSEKNFVKAFADYLCSGQKIIPKETHIPHVDLKYWYLGQTFPLLRKIQRELSRGNIIAIGYYASFLQQDGAPIDPKSAHASVVVGRRWNSNKNTCEVLIRNSWGSSCRGYGAQSLNQPGACDRGNIWVDENVLKDYITDIEFLH